MTTHRPPGLYEELITRRLEAALEEVRGEGWREEIGDLDAAEAPGVLARFIHDLVEPLLGSLSGDGGKALAEWKFPLGRPPLGTQSSSSATFERKIR